MKITLGANELKPLSKQGANFYYSSGSYPITVKLKDVGETREYELYAGMGVRMQAGLRFDSIEIQNGALAQDINFECSDADIYDNRSVLANTQAMPVYSTLPANRVVAVITLASGQATQILAADATRKKAAIYFAGDVFLGGSTVTNANGYPVSGGTDVLDENTGALYAYAVTATTAYVLASNQ